MRERKNVVPSFSLALFVSVAIVVGASGCGATAHTGSSTAPSASSSTPDVETHAITSSVIPPGQRVRGDSDADNPGDIDGNGDSDSARVGGADKDSDNPTRQSYRFPDSDDKATFAYGHPASAAEERAIASVAARYYAAGSAGDGATACSLLLPEFARLVPETYGQDGPPYLHGGKTCAAVLSLLFAHYREQLVDPVTVIQVRVQGNRAHVVLSSRTLPASYIMLVRQGGSWKVQELFGQPLP